MQAFIEESRNNGFRSLFILSAGMNDQARRFLLAQYGLEISDIAKSIGNRHYDRGEGLMPITAFHQWHSIVGNFNFNTGMNLVAKPAVIVNHATQRGRAAVSPLIVTEQTPLIVEAGDIFINVDFSVGGQNLLSHPSFPIIIYRAFSWISQFDGHGSNYAIGDAFRHRQGTLRSPSGDEFDVSLVGFRFTEPGIWTYTDPTGTRNLLAVNMVDFENQSQHNPMTEIDNPKVNILGSDYINRVLTQDMGNEIWKVLLWGALLFLATEMLLVLFLQKMARVG